MRHPLLWRIALPYAVLVVLVIGGLAGFLSIYLRDLTLQQTGARLLAEARLAREDVAPILAKNPNDPQINRLAQVIAGDVNGRVTVILPDGTVVGESDRPTEGMENHLTRPEVQGALRNRETTSLRYSSTLGQEFLYAAVPILRDGKIIGVMRVAYPFGAIQATNTRLVSGIGAVTAVAAVLTIILAFWIASYTLRPLQTLSTTVEQVSRGLLPEISPTRGKDEISQLQTVFRDMLDQLRARFNELRAERGKLEAVLMNMTDGILIANPEGSVILANPAALRLFGAEGQESFDRSLVEVVRHYQIVELWRLCLSSGLQQSRALEIGTGRYNIQAFAIPLGPEMEGAVLLIFQDLTRVRHLETVRRDFISNVSHELRTPLASLKALAETLQEGALEDPPAARRFLAQMETEIDNLTQMVRELLELSRIESGRVPLERRAVDPCELVGKAAERMRLQAERAGLSLALDCPEGLPPVLADPVRIEQVMVNLLHNAVKFTAPGGKLTAGLYARQHDVVIYVRDTGVGIAPEELSRIFERFYKADRSRSGGGTGLGLSIARHLVESHNGTIWAESTPGQGSTFSFTLPRVSER